MNCNTCEKVIAPGDGYYCDECWGQEVDRVLFGHHASVNAPEDVATRRKATPVFSGVLKYFPDAIREVARCSYICNEQHNPGTDMHWDRAKSGDELDALTRHLLDAGTRDSDGTRHSAKVAWRALANLQKEIEAEAGQ